MSSQKEGIVRTASTTIDEECLKIGEWPDLIKIDVEGSELRVLNGAVETLKRKPVIFIEIHLNDLEDNGTSPLTVTDFLADRGFGFWDHEGRPVDPHEALNTFDSTIRLLAKQPTTCQT